ncbi:DNA-binding transcriptional regulator, LysR family [Variovorax sp. OK605]|jgi:LysR family transcriptional regulator for bpeEF and oprC|uniref:LysR family transcriptional regulator n=1 Tax=Variovorax sp. OK605 TaxID=1855317 RepID=UPI0008ED9AC3|nr:LysR family transcriptional regulator [Variovorax sp. OK605]SFQ61666.1 DNA-binding transcriptional regulator, LysR family [Variovorax sp. OK605]
MDQITAMRVFARVVEAGTFTRAADSLQMPKPTVTKLVQQLETRLRVKLLQRTTRRVTVTPEGAAYYERTARVLAELEDIESDLTNAQAHPRGRLRVDIGSSFANMILIPQLPAFHARYPEIELEIGVSDRPVNLVGDAVDCVIRAGELTDQSLVARRIATLRFVTCATPAYLERHGVPKTPADLGDGTHRVVGYFSSLSNRPIPLRYGRDDERVEIHGHTVVGVNESTAHLTAVLTGMGVAQVFDVMVASHLESGALVEVLQGWTPPPYPLHVVYPTNRHLSAKLRVFVDWAVELFAPYNARAAR